MTTGIVDSRSAVFDAALDAIITIDCEGRIVELNSAAERTFGLSRDEAVGRMLGDTIVPERFRAAHHNGLQRYLATGEGPVIGKRIELSALRADGSEFPVELAITRVPGVDPPIFTGFMRDLTETRRSERRRAAHYRVGEVLAASITLDAAVRPLLKVLAETFDAVFASLWIADGDVLRCAETFQSDQITDSAFSNLCAAMTFVRGIGLPGRIWSSGEPAWIENVLHDRNFPRAEVARHIGLHAAWGFPVRLDQETLAVFEFFSMRVLERDEDMVHAFSSIGRQVGQFIARKRAEDDRTRLLVQERRLRQEAEEANHAKDDFLAMVSHELRTPLNALLGWVTMLKSAALSPDKRQAAVEAIDRSAKTQAQLIEDLLDVTRIVRGTLKITCASIDAAAVMRATVELLQPAAADRGLAIHTDGLDRPVAVWADRTRLQQVVWNLVSNAIKFTPKDGLVEITLAVRDFDIELVVRDTGVGIKPEFLPHLFERYRQGHGPSGGLGLGLAIVHHLVALHGGEVEATSAGEGKGSAFTVVLPREAH